MKRQRSRAGAGGHSVAFSPCQQTFDNDPRVGGQLGEHHPHALGVLLGIDPYPLPVFEIADRQRIAIRRDRDDIGGAEALGSGRHDATATVQLADLATD